jgi:multidrug efflux pump subunit AcrB
MTRHRVAPNILMVALLVGGALLASRIKKEVFPDFELDLVSVTVPYPGASPEEVERGIVLVVEEAIRGIEGVKEVTSVASEGRGRVQAELYESADSRKAYQEIDQQVARIVTFPEDAERPEVVLETRRRNVLTVEIYGDVGEQPLREIVESVRDRLLLDPEITQIDLAGTREYEVHVEVPQARLRAHGLTLEGIARTIAATSVELPGGKIETRGGEILLRTKERREWAREFARIPVVTTPDGTVVRLDAIATVRDTFQDTDAVGTYNGQRAMGLEVFRVGDQTPIGVSDAVRRVMAEIEPDLPPGVRCGVRNDMSDIYRQRLELLTKNAFYGLVLVLLLLGAFLEIRLAFWVTMGIPTSFLGAMLFLPLVGVTFNMISMFAFIIALGIVVDDAIVAGENIYEYRQRGMSPLAAAIRGARDVASPVSFSILTNIVAFLPLLYIPGAIGKIWSVIPMVVITTFTISWLEAIFILPAHLAHAKGTGRTRAGRLLHDAQQAFGRLFLRAVHAGYGPLVRAAARYRYATVATGLTLLAAAIGYVASGRVGIILMPKVDADYAFASATLPVGAPLTDAVAVRDRLERAARAVGEANGGDRLLEGVFALVNENVVEVRAYLTAAEVRPITTAEFTRQWRRRADVIPGLETLQFVSNRGGPGGGAALTVELSHRDIGVLDRAGAALAAMLADFPNVKDIDDGYTPGKPQLDLTLRPEGHSLGLTVREVARQVRAAFYGAEALRQQRGRSEVRVRVRLPEAERLSEYDIEELLIRTPSGRDVPLRQVAEVARGRAYTLINRREGRRTVLVTGDVEPLGETGRIMETISAEVFPRLVRDYPGLGCGYEGQQTDLRESMQSLLVGLGFALLAVFVLLAIPFRSYVQPLIVMTSIPFGLVGALLGHVLMGFDMSIMSLMGIVALSGVVVNDALVMIDFANGLRAGGAGARDAICQAGVRRFRPILLTTLTTFGGLAPMIFETSRQAQFMIPMALSLGYGILFSTAITLLIVPALYLILEDVLAAGRRLGLGG